MYKNINEFCEIKYINLTNVDANIKGQLTRIHANDNNVICLNA